MRKELMTTREYSARPPKPKTQRYVYRDEFGNYLFDRFRIPKWNKKEQRWDKEVPYYVADYAVPEDQRWHRPYDGSHRRVLYRLPEYMAADPTTPVYLTEGESDCDELSEAGFLAVTHALGAGNATREHLRWLADRPNPIILTADRDVSGARCAVRRYDLLAELGKASTIVRPVPSFVGADVRDHLDAGCAVEDLVPVDVGQLRPIAERARLTDAGRSGEGESSDWHVIPQEWLCLRDPDAWNKKCEENARRARGDGHRATSTRKE